MVSHNTRNPRNPNATVRFSLHQFTRRLGHLFGLQPEWKGPGPISVERSGHHSPRGDRALSYLFEEIFSKFDDGVQSSSKDDVCVQRFFESERLCTETNARFKDRHFLFQGNLSPDFSVSRAIWLAQRKVEWLLGEYDDREARGGMGFGPGASTRLPRRSCDIAYKFGGIPQGTLATIPLVEDVLRDMPNWYGQFCLYGSFIEVVEGNKIVSVPKNYKTNRMIAIEPDWNMFLQKGIGAIIRSKLRRVGVDLNDQSNNAFCAGLGSLYGDLATIDLSMASDCVSYELVRFMLPADWFDALEQCRSPVGVLASGEVVKFQKFSSMGNGYTFELESLIFWALCSSVVDLMQLKDRRVLVYGDDLIVPTAAAQNVCDVLAACGFVPNEKKTFVEGPFRESCGSHFLDGHDVTPIYIRESVKRLDRLFLLHNNCARLLERFCPFVLATPEEVSEFLTWIRSHAPEQWQQPRLPRLDIGDGAFYGCFSSSTPKRLSRGWEGWRIKTLQSRAVVDPVNPKGDVLLKGLWAQEQTCDASVFSGNSFSLRYGRSLTAPLSLLNGTRASALKAVSTADVQDSPRNSDSAKTQRVEWRVSKQIVLSLALDYCWWEALHPTE